MCMCRLLKQESGSGESSVEVISQEEDATEQMFPKVSIKITEAVIPLHKGKHTWSSDHPTCINPPY